MIDHVPLRSSDEIAMSRAAGKLAAEVLAMVAPFVKPGVTTGALDKRCHDYIVDVLQATPANIGYQGYQHTVLTS